ncbi:MAG: IPT/TIG domain-containing protein, partial [Bryobacteraceae bacterium]
IAPVAPGFFSYAGTGGLAAAQITRVHGDGSRDNENVYQTESGGKLAPLPINLGPSTDQVYLILYGTGIRGRSALSNVSVTIGGANAQVLYAGPQGAFVGEDQVNVLIPRSLAGMGNVPIVLTADGESSNAVNVTIQ